jgi:hypothetical protein
MKRRTAEDPSALPAALDLLAGDLDWDWMEAPANPALLGSLKQAVLRQHTAWRMVSRSSRPAKTLALLANNHDPTVRCLVARHRDTPAPVLERLAGDPHSDVRQAVAGNPNVPSKILERMLQDQDREVTREAVRNPALPRAALAMWQLAGQGYEPFARPVTGIGPGSYIKVEGRRLQIVLK